MKKAALMAAVLAAGLVLSYGCGGSDKNDDNGDNGGGGNSSIVGTWIDTQWGYQITLTSGGRYTVSDSETGEVWDTGTWSTSGSRITTTSDDDGETDTDTFSISGNTLTVVTDEGTTDTLTRA